MLLPRPSLNQRNRIATVVSLNQRNSIAIVALVAGLPIVLKYVSESPFALTILDTARPYLVWPSTIGTYQVRPLPYFLGNAPTVGQGIYIALFLIVNIVLSAIEYEPRLPSSLDDPERRGVKAYVLYRCGAFALSLFPVVILFSSRNNVLLWLTNWSHSTYLLLHQWVGRLFALYAILHSILGLMVYVNRQHRVWAWSIWGAIATVTCHTRRPQRPVRAQGPVRPLSDLTHSADRLHHRRVLVPPDRLVRLDKYELAHTPCWRFRSLALPHLRAVVL
jgi:uncharacterized membrane protein